MMMVSKSRWNVERSKSEAVVVHFPDMFTEFEFGEHVVDHVLLIGSAGGELVEDLWGE